MRAKIHRLTSAKSGKVDASDYGPEQVLDSEAKTGMRPISRRAYKKGGKVVAVSGADAKQNAGKKPRSGGSKHLTIDGLVNRNYKDANEAREGKKHIGGLKTGGRANKQYGGTNGRPTEERDMMSPAERKLLFESAKRDYPTQGAPAPKKAPAKTPDPVYRGRSVTIPVSDEATPLRARKHGGKAWEGSAKDEAQDKKLAKKHGMSMSAWEKSAMDKKHDTQHSTKGLKKGGRTGKSLGGILKDVGKYAIRGGALGAAVGNKAPIMGGLGAMAAHFLGKKKGDDAAPMGKKRGGFTSLDGEMQTQEKVSGRVAKRDGGSLAGLEMNQGGRAKKSGKTNINIVIATGKGQQMPMEPGMPPAPGPQGVPIPMPASPPPQAGAPMPMPIPVPMGGPGAGPAPMPRKAGGRTYRSYKDMDAGAGSGLGRLEKTEIQKRKK
jgi:hypothetical protein